MMQLVLNRLKLATCENQIGCQRNYNRLKIRDELSAGGATSGGTLLETALLPS